MIKLTPPSQGLLFSSFLFRRDLHTSRDLSLFWEQKFGECFTLTPKENPLNDYYSKEMGSDLSRIFLLTSSAFPREFLLSTKLQAIAWEEEWSKENRRMVNVDIGFLAPENFILATTKNYSHRVYLGQNIFADLTYHFHQGEFKSFPWTYPDYLDTEKIEFLTWGRSFLLQNRSN
ncbi:MAG: DUF4416 family protein [Bacteriovoracia bacterium]